MLLVFISACCFERDTFTLETIFCFPFLFIYLLKLFASATPVHSMKDHNRKLRAQPTLPPPSIPIPPLLGMCPTGMYWHVEVWCSSGVSCPDSKGLESPGSHAERKPQSGKKCPVLGQESVSEQPRCSGMWGWPWGKAGTNSAQGTIRGEGRAPRGLSGHRKKVSKDPP